MIKLRDSRKEFVLLDDKLYRFGLFLRCSIQIDYFATFFRKNWNCNYILLPMKTTENHILGLGFGLLETTVKHLLTRNKSRWIMQCAFVMHTSLFSGFAQAQEFSQDDNLIPNSGFEELQPNMFGDTICPSNGSLIGLSRFWSSGGGSVDFFHECSNDSSPGYGVPQNLVGYQENATDGTSAYANIAVYSTLFTDAREYLMMRFDEPLRTEQGYYVRFKLSLNDSSNFAVGNIGVLFTQDNPQWFDDEDYFASKPQVESGDGLITDKTNWVTVEGAFLAEGGEKYMTIGNYLSDDELNFGRVDSIPETLYNREVAAYYIDDKVSRLNDRKLGISRLRLCKVED